MAPHPLSSPRSGQDDARKKAVPYYRVSTEKQGISRLGLEAQQKSVEDYAAVNGLELLAAQIEVWNSK